MPKLKLAIILALTTAFISGTNNFLTKFAVTSLSDPVVFTFLKNIFVSAILLSLLMSASRWREVRSLNSKQLIQLLLIGIVGGGIPFILFFTGLSMIPAMSAAFIHKTLFIWVALLAVPFLKEKINWYQFAALALLVIGNLGVFNLPRFSGHTGELLVFGATLLWAIENIIAKKALAGLSSLLVATSRMVIGSLVILAVIIYQHNVSLLFSLSLTQVGWTILTGSLLTAYVLTWYTALKYAPATLVASLLVPATIVSNILTTIFITRAFPPVQLLSATLVSCALVLLISLTYKSNRQLSSTSRAIHDFGITPNHPQ